MLLKLINYILIKNNNIQLTPYISNVEHSSVGETAKLLGTLNSSFDSEIASVPYVEKLISEVEEVMEGKMEETGWRCEMAIVHVSKELTGVSSGYSDEGGNLPTSEIYALLKDWLEFLKEYYKRSFVPLEWIKEEYLEEAKKLQKPING